MGHTRVESESKIKNEIRRAASENAQRQKTGKRKRENATVSSNENNDDDDLIVDDDDDDGLMTDTNDDATANYNEWRNGQHRGGRLVGYRRILAGNTG